MEKKEEIANLNFFKKVLYSITKFEKYPIMATEGLPRAIKYLVTLMIIVTIFTMFGTLLQMNKLINNLAQYIQNNIPDFIITEGKVEMDVEQPIIIEDVQYTGIDKIIVNPLAENNEQKEQSENDETIVGTTIFFFKDEIILKSKINNDNITTQKYTYSEFVANYTGENISSFSKNELINYLTSQKMSQFYIRYGSSIFIYLLLLNIIYVVFEVLEIAILGWITASIARIKMKFIAICNMAIYSLTLPIILNIMYIIVNYFVTFKITYFQVAYITIAYIYLATTIFILKDDIIKKMQEVEKIKQEQKRVKEEMKEQKEQEPKEKDKEEKREEKEKNKENKDKEGEEPQGSEA